MEKKITGSVGKDCENKTEDVDTIDTLLRAVGMLEPEGLIATVKSAFRRVGLVDAADPAEGAAARITAIKRFQEIWGILTTAGQPDGKISPKGKTIDKLNQTTIPLTLAKIEHDKDKGKKINKGGYKISFTPAPPPKPYQVWLGVSPAPGDYVDVTGCNPKDVMTVERLPALLKLIEKHRKWGLRIDLRLFVAIDGRVITTSIDSQPLQCPVYPHNGVLLPLDETNNGEKLIYQQNPETGKYEGRFLEKVEGFDKYFFAYYYKGGSANFETDPKKRGFDCITYAGAVCCAPPTKMGDPITFSQWVMEKMAGQKCSCEIAVPASKGKAATTKTVEMEKASLSEIAEYFKTNTTGYHVMWMNSHVVLVADGIVHEFHGGYFRPTTEHSTPVAKWLEDKKGTVGRPPQSVRKLGKKPDRAS